MEPTFFDTNVLVYATLDQDADKKRVAASLLCWLTRAEHTEADRRQRALKKVVPDGDLHVFDYQYLRTLQDPRVTDRANFECVLSFIAQQHFHRDGLTFDARMERDMTHHMEH